MSSEPSHYLPAIPAFVLLFAALELGISLLPESLPRSVSLSIVGCVILVAIINLTIQFIRKKR
jgi:hypothetical protein